MAKKQELAVIDFTQFSVAQLPELKGKKDEIKSVIEANPIVEIVDNATYESAKKSRTAVRTLRTSLESEQKTVKKRIKENVLDVVDKEYDTFVLGVKSAEQSRQSPIDAWENKKEQEKQEKARLEQERIDGIKTKISDYVASWKEAFGFMVFGSIKEVSENFAESNANFDKTALQEFDVLFDREVSTLAELLENKISTLEEQEQIRVDNLLIQEKNAEQSKIQEWQRTWNANIDTLSISDIADIKSVLAKSKLADLKHYVSGYEEIYLSTEKRLYSQIEFVSKAEEQRIAQEKLVQEKKEFEEKKAEAKFKERKNILFDEGYWEIFFRAEANENNEIAKSKLVAYSEDEFDKFLDAVKKARTPIDEVEVVAEEVVEMPLLEETQSERVYDSEPISSVSQTIVNNNLQFADYKEPETREVEFEETWDKIQENFEIEKYNSPEYGITEQHFEMKSLIFNWLKENYNVPIKK